MCLISGQNNGTLTIQLKCPWLQLNVRLNSTHMIFTNINSVRYTKQSTSDLQPVTVAQLYNFDNDCRVVENAHNVGQLLMVAESFRSH